MKLCEVKMLKVLPIVKIEICKLSIRNIDGVVCSTVARMLQKRKEMKSRE